VKASAKSLTPINLGCRNFVNLSLGQFVEKWSYKLEQQGIGWEVANESYTSKASFVDSDELPKKSGYIQLSLFLSSNSEVYPYETEGETRS